MVRPWVPAAWTVVVPLAAFFAIFTLVKEVAFLVSSSTTTGIVVFLDGDTEYEHGKMMNTFTTPIISFTDAQGESIWFRAISSIVFIAVPQCTFDQRVPVRYVPSEPRHAQIDDFYDEWEITILIGLVGAVPTWIGLPPVLRARRRFVPHPSGP